LSAAREGLAGLASISDISSQLHCLVGPVPAELWLAVAERTAAEQDIQSACTALDHAEHEAGDDFRLGALIRERRAELLADSNAASSEQADALLTAGDYRWQAGQPDIARRHFQAVLDLRPDDVRAALSLAGAEAATWLSKPVSESAEHLMDIVAGFESLQAQHGIDAGSAWTFLIVADLHAQLASAAEDPGTSHMWQAMLAAGRALALDPGNGACWARLSNVLGTLGLYQNAVFAAKRARDLDPGPRPGDDVTAALIQAATNVGDLQTAQELLPDDVEHRPAWIQAVGGFVWWRLGRRAEAIKLLRVAVTEDPNLLWAQGLLMQAYLLAGAGELARNEARQLLADIGERRDRDALSALAWGALIGGDLAGAERLGLDLARSENDTTGEGSGLAVVGMAKLLGNRADGLADLAGSLGRTRTPLALDDWQLIERPVLEALARERGIKLPDLTPLEDVIAGRRAMLARLADPLTELAEAPTGHADPVTTEQARALLNVLVLEARPDPAGARAALGAEAVAQALPEWPGLADRVLRTYVDDCMTRGDLGEAATAEDERLAGTSLAGSAGRLPDIALLLSAAGRHDDAQRVINAARQRAGQLPELIRAEGDMLWRLGRRADAARAWESARAVGGDRTEARLAAWTAGSDRSAAVALLHTAITRSYADCAVDLCALPMEPADTAAVAAALERAASDPDTAAGAWVAAGGLALPGQLELPASGIEVHLPPSWFEGMEDSVAEDPLLARYIPEARSRLPWTLPGVMARDDARLEPDGYRILILGTIFEQGNLPVNADYVCPDAVPLLSEAMQARVTDRRFMDLVILRDAEEPAAGLDSLLLMPAAEVIGRRIEAVAMVFRKALEQFPRNVQEV